MSISLENATNAELILLRSSIKASLEKMSCDTDGGVAENGLVDIAQSLLEQIAEYLPEDSVNYTVEVSFSIPLTPEAAAAIISDNNYSKKEFVNDAGEHIEFKTIVLNIDDFGGKTVTEVLSSLKYMDDGYYLIEAQDGASGTVTVLNGEGDEIATFEHSMNRSRLETLFDNAEDFKVRNSPHI